MLFPANCTRCFARYPWFDPGPYFRWSRAGDRQIVLHGGVRERLMKQYGISKRAHDKAGFAALIHGLKVVLGLDRNFKSIGKVPLVRWERGCITYTRTNWTARLILNCSLQWPI